MIRSNELQKSTDFSDLSILEAKVKTRRQSRNILCLCRVAVVYGRLALLKTEDATKSWRLQLTAHRLSRGLWLHLEFDAETGREGSD